VAQASGYRGGEVEYLDSLHAEVRTVSRVDWRDLQSLIEGEAIILFAGRRIYAKLFHAAIEKGGPIRLKRPLRLPVPDPKVLKESADRVKRICEGIEKGMAGVAPQEAPSPMIGAMLDGFREAQRRGADGAGYASNGVEKAILHATEMNKARGDEACIVAMMEQAVHEKSEPLKDGGVPVRKVDARIYRLLVGLEEAVGASEFAAKERAFGVLCSMERAAESVARTSTIETRGKMRSEMGARELSDVIEQARAALVAEEDVSTNGERVNVGMRPRSHHA